MFLAIYVEMAAAFLHHIPPHQHHHHHHHHQNHQLHHPHQQHQLQHDSFIKDNNNNDNNAVNNNHNNNVIGSEIFYSWQQSSIIGKRKSAVELLQETKPLYVKSETVLDRKQQLLKKGSYLSVCGGQLEDDNNSLSYCNNDIAVANSAASCSGGLATCSPFITRAFSAFNSSPPAHSSHNNNYSTSTLPLPKSPKLIPPPPAFRKSTGSYQLQNDLRKLLNISKEDLLDSTENLSECNEQNVVDDIIFCNNDDNFSDDLELQEYLSSYKSNRSPNRQRIDFKCHKSLPDLTTTSISCNALSIHDSYKEMHHFSLSPNDRVNPLSCRKSQYHSDAVSVASCKNDQLFIGGSSKICPKSDQKNTDVISQRIPSSSLLPSSPCMMDVISPSYMDIISSSCVDVISPPSLYSDFKIQHVLPSSSQLEHSKSLRPILRSKSDVSGTRKIIPPTSYSSPKSAAADISVAALQDPDKLDDFFDHLGMDTDRYNQLTARSDCSSPIYFKSSSDSSIDSIGGVCASGGDPSISSTVNNNNIEVPSVVERNARIIKWLCNCRKTMELGFITPTSSYRHVSR